MTDEIERNPWDQLDGEPNRWFQRFCAFKLMGNNRSVQECVNRMRDDRGKERKETTPQSWSKAAATWQWRPRADAWDKYKTAQREAEQDRYWSEKIMGQVEVLGRMSEMGRTNIQDFVRLAPDGEIVGFNQKALQERGHLVKKISTTRGKSNSNAIELYDGQSALVNMGRHHRVFETQDKGDQAGDAGTFTLPADVIAPAFLDAYDDIKAHAHTEYVFHGGRGSTKSSFIGLVIIWLIKNNPTMHGIALRQVGNTMRDSVYSQLEWAINELGLSDQFKCTVSPLEITYLPTGQKIYFRGADEPGKIKSIKPAFGYIGIAWFEELDQFHGPEAVRNIEQSAIRGGDLAYIFKSFNPPRTAANWANKYIQIPKANQYQHHSTYLQLGSRIRWLGKPWVEEAEHLQSVNPKAFEHEYLGVANGTGGLVFENVTLRKITDEEIAQFDRVLHGLDWGFYPDPAHYSRVHYDAARMTLYIFGELRRTKTSNRQLYDDLVAYGCKGGDTIIADSAEPKSVADFRGYASEPIPTGEVSPFGRKDAVFGPDCRGAEKGPESVKYSMKWLQSLAAIIIDPERCPETAQEFLDYELEQDKDGEFISEYPDKNNHAIDSTRYATNLIWRRRGQ